MRRAGVGLLWIILLAILLLGIPRLSGAIASCFYYQTVDPDGAFAWITVHHLVQAFIFLLMILWLSRFKRLDFGLGWGKKEVGKQYVLRFALIFGLGSLASHLLVIWTGSFQAFPYPLSAGNIIGQLGFQLFLSGPSEELIFRAFAMTMLALVIRGRIIKENVSLANIIAAVIFGLAHVGFSFAPFAVRYDPFQVILSIILGLFYGDCYEKTNSVYYPMIMHSISNVWMVGFTIIATWIQ